MRAFRPAASAARAALAALVGLAPACRGGRGAPAAAATSGDAARDAGGPLPVPGDPFEDATAATGVVFTDVLGAERFVGGGVAFLDADGDGDPDLFVAGDELPSTFWRNRGDGTFDSAAAAAGLAGVDRALGAAVADVDNDGDPDLYVLRAGPDRLYVNDGSGAFGDQTAARGLGDDAVGTAAAFGDYDGDGWLDLYVGTYLDPAAAALPYPDRYRGSPNRLYRGTGGGTFAEVAAAPGRVPDPTLAAAWTDYDGDGDVDLWVVNDFGPFWQPDRLWRNDGGGAFTEVSAALGAGARVFGMGVSPADVDADGDLDFYVTNLMANVLHVQGPGGAFSDGAAAAGIEVHGFLDPAQGAPVYPVYDPAGAPDEAAMAAFMAAYAHPETGEWGATSWGAVFFDYDDDGWLDLFVANGFVDADALVPEGRAQPDALLHGEGDGRFAPAGEGGAAWDRGEARGAAAADWDGDGDLDLAVGRVALGAAPASVLLLRNRAGDGVGGAGGGGFVAVRLEGTVSNRDGVGARAVLTAGGGAFVRTAERSGGGGFLSAGAPALRFGLGGRPAADAVDVYWPSGLHDRFEGPLAAGTTLAAVEGAAPAP